MARPRNCRRSHCLAPLPEVVYLMPDEQALVARVQQGDERAFEGDFQDARGIPLSLCQPPGEITRGGGRAWLLMCLRASGFSGPAGRSIARSPRVSAPRAVRNHGFNYSRRQMRENIWVRVDGVGVGGRDARCTGSRPPARTLPAAVEAALPHLTPRCREMLPPSSAASSKL